MVDAAFHVNAPPRKEMPRQTVCGAGRSRYRFASLSRSYAAEPFVVDVFEEVEDQLRTEQYKRLALKALPWVAAALVAIVLIAGGWYLYHKNHTEKSEQAAAAYQAAMDTAAKGDFETAYKQFDEVAKNAPAGYKALALQVQGALRLQENRVKDAVALFDASAKAAPSGDKGLIIADAARLKSALALMDEAPYAEIEGRLKPLTEDDRPYRALALESLALAKINAGKVKEARADFESLRSALDASQGMIDRARAAIDLIDSGGAASVPAVVKAARDAPAVPMMAPAPAPGGAAQ